MKCEYENRQPADWQPTSLFQLYPTHDVFRGVLGKSVWTDQNKTWEYDGDEKGLWFGEDVSDTGVAMGLFNSDGDTYCESLKVRHCAKKGYNDVYQSKGWRGSFELDIRVDEIEIWRDVYGAKEEEKDMN